MQAPIISGLNENNQTKFVFQSADQYSSTYNTSITTHRMLEKAPPTEYIYLNLPDASFYHETLYGLTLGEGLKIDSLLLGDSGLANLATFNVSKNEMNFFGI